MSTPEVSSPVCAFCDKSGSTATLFCLQCTAPLCSSCSSSLHSRPFFNSHQLVVSDQKDRALAAQAQSKARQMSLCSEHHKELDIYCAEDKVLCCLYCVQLSTKHKGHELLTLSEMERNVKKEVHSLVSLLHEKQTDLKDGKQKLNEMLKDVTKDAEKVLADIKKNFESLRDKLDKRESELHSKISTIKDQRISSLNSLEAIVAGNMTKYEHFLNPTSIVQEKEVKEDHNDNDEEEENQGFLTSTSEALDAQKILQAKDELEANYDTLKSLLNPTEHDRKIRCAFDSEALLKIIQNFGYVCAGSGFIGTTLLHQEHEHQIQMWLSELSSSGSNSRPLDPPKRSLPETEFSWFPPGSRKRI